MGNKIIVSKTNAISAVRQALTFTKSTDHISGRELRKLYCSADYDSLTTYVQKKIWVPAKNNFIHPPYVECDYVA